MATTPKTTTHQITIDGKPVTVTMREIELVPFTKEDLAAAEAKRRRKQYRAWKRAGMKAEDLKPECRQAFLDA